MSIPSIANAYTEPPSRPPLAVVPAEAAPPPPAAAERTNLLAWGLICGAAMVLSVLHAAHFHHVCDDAFISFRYAHNLVAGNGLVFNVGERVMGYSDLLWVLMIAFLALLHIEPPTAGMILGTASSWATLLLVAHHVRRRHRGVLPLCAALGLLIANATFALWMFGGLEGHLLTALIVYAVLKTLELTDPSVEVSAQGTTADWVKVGVSLGLAGITRPEAIMYAGPVCAYMVLRSGWGMMRRAVVVGAVAGAIYGASLLWQLSYYGSAVPNTYYAKNLPLSIALLYRGLGFTQGFLRAYNYLPVMIVVAWVVSRWATTRKAEGWLPIAISAALAAFYMRIGGDSLVYYRMWLVTLPMFSLLVADLVASWEPGSIPQVVIAAAVIAMSLPASFVGGDINYLHNDDLTLMNLRTIGKRLHELPPETRLAANTVGILTYYSELPMVDMLGLNDAHIARLTNKYMGIPAHESHDGDYVLSREPDIIIPIFPWLQPSPAPLDVVLAYPKYQSDRDLFSNPLLVKNYKLEQLPVGHRGLLTTFVKSSYTHSKELASLLRDAH